MRGGCQRSDALRKRDFVTVDYVAGAPVSVPAWCPWHTQGGECHVRAHCHRTRKCGPGHTLMVAVCGQHRRAFTLYPVGWTPYGRASIDGADGVLSVVVAVAAASALSAAPDTRRAQVRAIRLAAVWLGLFGSSSEEIGDVLGHDLSVQAGLHDAFAQAGTWHRRAAVVAQAVEAIREPDHIQRLLRAGVRAGVLGRVWGVDPTCRALMALVPPWDAAVLGARSGRFHDFAGL